MTLSFYELLQEIEQKPGLYIGQPSITDLQIFLAGYHFARQELGIPLTDEELRFREFQPWLQQKFDITTSQSWARSILAQTADEGAAFERFFTLLREFSNAPSEDLAARRFDRVYGELEST